MLYLYPELVDMNAAKNFDISIEDFMPYLEHKKDEVIDGYIGNVGYSTFATKENRKHNYIDSGSLILPGEPLEIIFYKKI